jgi:hypothetical protein
LKADLYGFLLWQLGRPDFQPRGEHAADHL